MEALLRKLILIIYIICFPFNHQVWATPQNIIFIIGDGMGFEHIKAADMYANGQEGNLVFESFPYQAQVTTHPDDPLTTITDSAAGSTAMATSHKVNIGVISVAIPANAAYPVSGEPMETLLEHFKAQGKRLGLVTTTYISHATPAAFGAHESSRTNYSQIISDFLTQTKPNVLFGGAKHITGSAAVAAGYTVVTSKSEMQSLNTGTMTYVSGQFGTKHLPFEYDENFGTLPHLSEMTATALEILDNDPDGFFLMVEGGRIDHAGHNSWIERNIFETLELINTVQTILTWAEGRSDTLIIVTADHETGGLNIISNNGQGVFPTISWTAPGVHTGVNVPVYAIGENAQLLPEPVSDEILGTMDNTDFVNLVTFSSTVPVDYFCDADKDGYISSAISGSCTGTGCSPVDCSPTSGNDCDDSSSAINPNADDSLCNGLDDNCDGATDEDYSITATSCGVGICSGNTGSLQCQSGTEVDTCNPLAGAGPEGPHGEATCSDSQDNDCDGDLDQEDIDCVCIESGTIEILPDQTLSGNTVDVTSIVNAGNTVNLRYTVTEQSCNVDPGGTYIEAENFTGSITQGTGVFEVESTQTGYLGTGYLKSYQSGSTNTTCPAVDEGKEYRVNFLIPGTYKVWIRAYALDGSSDSVFIGLNGGCIRRFHTNGQQNRWVWSDNAENNTITIAAQGIQSLNIWVREPGILVDGIYITQGEEVPADGSLGVEIQPDTCDTPLFSGNESEAQSIYTGGWKEGEKILDVTGDDAVCGTPLLPAAGMFICNATYFRDVDDDGYGDPDDTIIACSPPNGYVTDDTDCNDTDAGLNPTTQWYKDSDRDSFGNPSVTLQQCIQPIDYVLSDTDCDDSNAAINPGEDEICDGADNDCDGFVDEEYVSVPTSCGKGVCSSTGQTECQDGVEIDTCSAGPPSGDDSDCNGVDNDCDGSADEHYISTPISCGVGECAGNTGSLECQAGTEVDTCDPFAGAAADDSLCNGLDDNCDGATDEDYSITATSCGVGICSGNTGSLQCQSGTEVDTCNPLAGAGPEGPHGEATCSDSQDNDCDGDLDQEDIDCVCIESGTIEILPDQTLSGNTVDVTSIVNAGNTVNLRYTVTEQSCNVDPGGTYIEAENFTGSITQGTGVFEVESTQTGYLGTGYLKSYQSGSTNTTCPAVDEGKEYRVNFLIPGTYKVWIRAYALDGSSDSVFIGLNGGCIRRFHTNGQQNRWVWSDNAENNTITIAAQGIQSLNIWVREPGILVDGIYITQGEEVPADGSLGVEIQPDTCDTPLFSGNESEAQSIYTGGWKEGEKILDVTGDDAVCGTPLLPAAGMFICNATYFRDVDDDGYGDPDDTIIACSPPNGYVTDDTDCNDTSSVINPGSVEACDGKDNDCDGTVDEDYVSAPTSCGQGICSSTGQIECQGGVEVDTCTAGTPTGDDADCNGLDNDCDGPVDEHYVSVPSACGQGVCTSTGQIECQGGVEVDTCTAGPPTGDDTDCNGLDNDCDGSVDEHYVTTPTSCGQGVCLSTGQIECQGGVEVDTCTAASSTGDDTDCNGLDNDCDGSVDEHYVTTPTSCGQGVCLSTGQIECQGGVEVNTCTAASSTGDDTDCNGLDNDCDGSVDEHYVTTPTSCGQGVCLSTGQIECQGGVELNSCSEGTPTGNDSACNGLDDDCDGSIDEEFIIAETTCGVGACSGNTGSIECQAGTEVDTCAPFAGANPEIPNGETCNDSVDNDCDGDTDQDDIDCNCTESGLIEVVPNQTLNGNSVDITSIVNASNAANLWFTVTEGGSCVIDPGGTYIEAENFTGSITQGTGVFTIESTHTGYSGSGYLRSYQHSTTHDTCPAADEGKEYSVNFPVPGTYRVWIRAYAVNGNSDSLFIGLNGGCITKFHTNFTQNSWVWSDNLGENIITIAAPGIHHLNIWVRESDIMVDGIYITQGREIPDDASHGTEIDPVNCSTLFSGNESSSKNVDTRGWKEGEKRLEVTGKDAVCGTQLSASAGGADFNYAIPETYCFDGLDNDANGLTDCDDPDCEGVIKADEILCGTEECLSTGNLLCNGGSLINTCTPLERNTGINETCDEGLYLSTGWHILSLPFVPLQSDIETVLTGISGSYSQIWSYEGTSECQWKVYPYGPGLDPSVCGLSEMTSEKGYWIEITEETNLITSGSALQKTITLKKGWNLTGLNSARSLQVQDALSSIAGKYISVWSFDDNSWKVYDPAHPELSDLQTMKPYHGYWINARESTDWTLP